MKGSLENRYYKKGVSVIIATVILIALTLAIISIVWLSTSDFVKKETSKSEKCFGIFEKVNLDSRKTCYNSGSRELHFFLRIGNLELDGILVGISSDITEKSFRINKESEEIGGLKMYNGSNMIILPKKDEGFEYVYNLSDAGFSENEYPKSIQISPIIQGIQCEISDTLSEIESCPI